MGSQMQSATIVVLLFASDVYLLFLVKRYKNTKMYNLIENITRDSVQKSIFILECH